VIAITSDFQSILRAVYAPLLAIVAFSGMTRTARAQLYVSQLGYRRKVPLISDTSMQRRTSALFPSVDMRASPDVAALNAESSRGSAVDWSSSNSLTPEKFRRFSSQNPASRSFWMIPVSLLISKIGVRAFCESTATD